MADGDDTVEITVKYVTIRFKAAAVARSLLRVLKETDTPTSSLAPLAPLLAGAALPLVAGLHGLGAKVKAKSEKKSKKRAKARS